MKQKAEFNRVLGRLDILVLAFGAMIGWGWVVLASSWVQSAGVFGSLLAFIIGSIMILFVSVERHLVYRRIVHHCTAFWTKNVGLAG